MSATFSTLIAALIIGGANEPGEQRKVATSIHGSIERSLRSQVGSDGAALAAQVARLIRGRGDIIRDVHPGDRLQLVFKASKQPRTGARFETLWAILSMSAYMYSQTINLLPLVCRNKSGALAVIRSWTRPSRLARWQRESKYARAAHRAKTR